MRPNKGLDHEHQTQNPERPTRHNECRIFEIAALIAVAAMGAYHNVGNSVENGFHGVSNKVGSSL